MGMFDWVRCEYPLPDVSHQDLDFQTKDLDDLMNLYTIHKDGRLTYTYVMMEEIPEIERKPIPPPPTNYEETPGEELERLTSVEYDREVGRKVIEIPYHGVLIFYTSIENRSKGTYEWIQYHAHFNQGHVVRIERNCDHGCT